MIDRGGREPSSRRVLVSLAIQFFVNGFVYATFIARLPQIRDRVGISLATLGLALTASSLAGLIGSFFTARVIGWFGSKQVMVIGGLAYVAALPVIGWSTSTLLLIAGLVALGLVDVFIDVAMNLQGSVVSAERDRPVMSRLHGLWSLGTVSGGLTAALVAGAGVKVTQHYLGAALVLACAVALVGPGLAPVDRPHPEQAPPSNPAAGRTRWALTRPAIALTVAAAAAVVLDVTAGEWAALRMTDDLNATARIAATAFAAYTTGVTVARLAGDWLAVRLGQVLLTRVGITVAAAGLAVACLAPTPPPALVGFLVAGLGTSVLEPQLADAAARAPGPPGSGFTQLFLGHRVAALTAPALIGALAGTRALDVGAAMALTALPCAAALALIASAAIPPRR